MNFSTILQFLVIISSSFCQFGEGVKDGERTLSEAPCYCGVKLMKNNLTVYPWKLYVHLTVANNPNMTRTCGGTVIASNVILTSRRCLLKGHVGGNVTGHQKSVTSDLQLKDIVVSETLTKGEGTTYPVTAILGETNCSKSIGLRVDYDFTSRDSRHPPVCIPTQEELLSVVTVLGRNLTYDSPGGDIHNLVTKKGQDCDPKGALNLGANGIEEDVLCVSVTQDSVDLEVGQPLFAEVRRNPYEKNSYPRGFFTYLVGITSLVLVEGEGRRHLFFMPVNSILKDLNSLTKGPMTRWCTHPWVWTVAHEKIKRNKSLDCECGIPPERLQGRIVNGNDAIPYEFPWMVKLGLYLFQKGEYNHDLCGGTIINDRLILTAAHCVSTFDIILTNQFDYDVQAPNQSYTAFLHSHNWGKDSQQIPFVAKLGLVHPGFVDAFRGSMRRIESDIALLVLNEPLDFTKVDPDGEPLYKPICLPNQGERIPVIGREALISGWGKNSTEVDQFPDVLQKTLATLRPQHKCAEQLGGATVSNFTSNPLLICTVDANVPHPWSGDSGGPISIPGEDGRGRQTQVGVASFVSPGKASFYADLQELLPWVDYYADLYGGRYCRK